MASASSSSLNYVPSRAVYHECLFMCFQIDQNTKEDFNVTSDVEFNGIKSLVLGRVHGK